MGLKCFKGMPDDNEKTPEIDIENIQNISKVENEKLYNYMLNLEKKLNEEIEKNKQKENQPIEEHTIIKYDPEIKSEIRKLQNEIQELKKLKLEMSNIEKGKMDTIDEEILDNKQEIKELKQKLFDDNVRFEFVTNYLKNESTDMLERVKKIEEMNEKRWF